MITITRFETPLRALGGLSSSTSQDRQLARSARAASNAASGLSRSSFVADLGPRDTERVIEWSDELRDNRAWLKRVLDRELENTSAELTKTARAVFNVLARHGATSIKLGGLSNRVNGMHLAMVLRATADELDGTNDWNTALEHARTALNGSGINADQALYGLSKTE